METPQMCSGRRYGSIDLQHDFFGSGHDHDLRSDLQHDFLRSSYISFDVSSQEKHDAAKYMWCLYWVKSYSRKAVFLVKTVNFRVFALWRQTADLRSNLRTPQRKNVKRAIECAFLRRCSSSTSRVMRRFVDKCWKRQNLSLWWPDLWPDIKNNRSSFVMSFTLVRMPLIAYRYTAKEPS